MGPRPIGTPDPEVLIEYDSPNKVERLIKEFDNLRKARAFWLKMSNAGRCPHYKNPNKEPQT